MESLQSLEDVDENLPKLEVHTEVRDGGFVLPGEWSQGPAPYVNVHSFSKSNDSVSSALVNT